MAHFTRRGFFGGVKHVEFLLDGADLVNRQWTGSDAAVDNRQTFSAREHLEHELLRRIDDHSHWQRVDPLTVVKFTTTEPAGLSTERPSVEALRVAADELIEQGDTWGQLLNLAAARHGDASKVSALEVELARACADRFLADASRVLERLEGRIEWTSGLPEGVVLGDQEPGAFQKRAVQEALDVLKRSALSRRARRWSLGVTTEADAHVDDHLEALLALHPPRLTHVSLGHSGHQLSWTVIPDPASLAVFEHLTSVRLRGGLGVLERLELPRLTDFALETGSMKRASLATIAAARWPVLERLELSFGSYQPDYSAADIEALLSRLEAPRLHHLGLLACETVQEVIPLLARWPRLRSIRSLDLSKGGLQRSDVKALSEHWPAFAHLERFDLSDNMLAATGNDWLAGRRLPVDVECGQVLRAVCPSVVLEPQRSEDESDGERFASVGE